MSSFIQSDYNRIQNQQANQSKSSKTENTSQKVDDTDVDDFQKSLTKGDDDGFDLSKYNQKSGNQEGQNPFANMSNPLDSIFSNAMKVDAKAEVQAPKPAEINEKLVQTILVSSPDADSQEVRLTLSRDVLPDTEIKISRDLQGNLNVTLTSNNVNSFQTLVQGQHDLRALLEKNENNVRVNVESGDTSSSGEHPDGNRQSSTYQAYNNNNDDED